MAQWDKIQERGRVEDRRGRPVMVAGGAGLGLIAIVLLISLFTGTDPGQILDEVPAAQGAPQTPEDAAQYEGVDAYEEYVSRVIGSGNALWRTEFERSGLSYREPTTVLFRQGTESACGGADSRSGPHYCPPDETIYLDETFFDELTQRFGARGGEVAEAYVLAHELGHHVQAQIGLTRGVDTNEEQIALELQADCFAGVWAHSVEEQGVITRDEVGQAIDAAAAVGDDKIQEKVTGRVNPETWTHGSSEQRKQWFLTGFETGDPAKCDTR